MELIKILDKTIHCLLTSRSLLFQGTINDTIIGILNNWRNKFHPPPSWTRDKFQPFHCRRWFVFWRERIIWFTNNILLGSGITAQLVSWTEVLEFSGCCFALLLFLLKALSLLFVNKAALHNSSPIWINKGVCERRWTFNIQSSEEFLDTSISFFVAKDCKCRSESHYLVANRICLPYHGVD